MLYDGESYPVNWNAVDRSRFYMPEFYGLIYDPTDSENELYNEPILKFGELEAGTKNDYEMTLVMPDGDRHSIKIVRVPKKKYHSKQTVTVDGKVLSEWDNGSPNIRLTFVVGE